MRGQGTRNWVRRRRLWRWAWGRLGGRDPAGETEGRLAGRREGGHGQVLGAFRPQRGRWVFTVGKREALRSFKQELEIAV